MPTKKKTAKVVASRLKDLRPKKDAKGGALDAAIKTTGQRQGGLG